MILIIMICQLACSMALLVLSGPEGLKSGSISLASGVGLIPRSRSGSALNMAMKKKEPSKYRYLRALPCNGYYNQGGVYTEYIRAMRQRSDVETEDGFVKTDRTSLPSFFLAPKKISIEECIIDEDGNSCKRVILRGVVPVPLRSGGEGESALMAAMSTSTVVKQSRAEKKADYSLDDDENGNESPIKTMSYSWSGGVIADRSRGLFDSLCDLFPTWLGKSYGGQSLRKVFYDRMKQSRGGYDSPYHLFLALLKELCGLRVTGILIEVADSPSEATLSLGAAVMVTRINLDETGYYSRMEGADQYNDNDFLSYMDPQVKATNNWILTISNYEELIKEQRKRSAPSKLVDCFLDEAMGLHFATDIPIVTAKSLYDRVSVDGLLEQRYFVSPKVNVVRAPYFEESRDAKIWEGTMASSRARPPKQVQLVSEIENASDFLKMRLSEKRACLRASGIKSMPRPREGPRMVDAIMIPLLDEEVAYEVLRRLGETRGDFKAAAEMADFESRKPEIARAYNEALKAGKEKEAQALMAEFNSLSTLRYDPSNPDEDVYASSGPGGDDDGRGGFDIEEWYWEQRKRVYNIVA